MKRTLSVFLTAALALSLLAGCGPKTPPGTSSSAPGTSSSQPEDSSQPGSSSQPGDTSAASGPTPRLMVLSGPTGVGAAKLMANADDGFPSAPAGICTPPPTGEI